jgi:hypothetical protein
MPKSPAKKRTERPATQHRRPALRQVPHQAAIHAPAPEEENPEGVPSQEEAAVQLEQVIARHRVIPGARPTKGARAMVIDYLINSLYRISPQHPAFGELKHNELRMPRHSLDKRKLTWEALIKKTAKKLVNRPVHIDDCWFIKATPGSSYHDYSIAAKGGSNRYALHRVFAVLEHPEDYDKINTREAGKRLASWVCAHRCNRGIQESGSTCINPRHITICTQQENLSHRACVNGCAFLCPHTPKCIFTDFNGYYLPCRNRTDKLPETCNHPVRCLQTTGQIMTRSSSARF